MKSRIVCAALRNKEYPEVIVIGPRHYDNVMRTRVRERTDLNPLNMYWDQGFIDQFGNFFSREAALQNLTIIRTLGNEGSRKLFSEHL